MTMYCVSDLHGQLNLWRKIQKILQPEDKLFCLGDCIDRGPDGITILTEMLDDPRVKLLMGNHEDFLARCTIPLLEKTEEEYMNMTNHPWIGWNGGLETFDYMRKNMTNEEIIQLIDKINKLPHRVDIINGEETIVLTHAGCDPWIAEKEVIWHSSMSGRLDGHPYIWDREHICDEPFPEGYENTFVIHGHTPVLIGSYWSYMWKKDAYAMQDPNNWEAIHYCEGHKICIDMGAFFSHMTCLLDLHTFQETYIYDDDYYTITRTEDGVSRVEQKVTENNR